MNLLDIIKTLQKEGHSVQYYHRKDGGYVITRIDGQSFQGKSGNVQARAMTGQALSQAKSVQLARIRLPKGKKATKKAPLPEKLLKEMRKVQRAWRKSHPDISGTISTRGIRYQLEHYGEEKTLQSIDKAFRYSQGYAYIENVEFLLQRIANDLAKEPNADMQEVYDLIQQRMLDMKEEWLQPLHYDCLQQWEKGRISGEECAYKMKQIMSF